MESTLNQEDVNNLNTSEDGGDRIEVLDTEYVQVHVDAPNGGGPRCLGSHSKSTHDSSTTASANSPNAAAANAATRSTS